MKRSKRYNSLVEKTDSTKRYEIAEAIKTVKENAISKFDETIDVSYNLNLLAKHNIRDAITLPHSFGKTVKILVFAKGDQAEEAKKAGADIVGDDDLINKIAEGWTDFDVAIATPEMMKSLGKIARILGPKGLMPNPKTKTVTDKLKEAVESAKKGMREFRASKSGIINFAIAKASMSEDIITTNFTFFNDIIKKKKPTDLKGEYIKSITLSSTMGLGLKLNVKSL